MTDRLRGARWLATGCALAAAVALAWPAGAAEEGLRPWMQRRFLTSMSTMPQDSLVGLPGMTSEAVTKIMKFREGGKEFSSVPEFRKVSGLTDAQFASLSAHFKRRNIEQEATPGEEGVRTPISKAKARGLSAERESPPAAGRGDGPPAASPAGGGGLDVEARGNYYALLPGYDLSVLSDEERRAFLDTINTEMCSCGCTGETLGFCLVNDPGCMVVKARVKKLYKDITGKDPVIKADSAGK